MPTYQYKCIFCDFEFEKRKKVKNADEEEGCSQCGSVCRRLISGGSGFLLKGDGWGRDGYSDKVKFNEKKENM